MGFAVAAVHRVKNKKSETIHKYLDLAREVSCRHEGDGDWALGMVSMGM